MANGGEGFWTKVGGRKQHLNRENSEGKRETEREREKGKNFVFL